jgi:hypothetical protein
VPPQSSSGLEAVRLRDDGGVEARRADAGGALDARPVGRGVADFGVRAKRARPTAAVDVGHRAVLGGVGAADTDGAQRGVADRARAVAVALALNGQRARLLDAAALLAATVDVFSK